MAKYAVLDLFYKSKQWTVFRDLYIAERLLQDGGYFCDYCGEPIDILSDIVLHHTEDLTPDNVNDPLIALNKEKIKQVHSACHNTIHKHAAGGVKKVYIVYGPPLSGKAAYVKRRAWPGDIIVDMDNLYQAISGLPRYNKPDPLLYNVLAIQDVLLEQIRTRFGRWDNAWVIGGYADKYKRNMLADSLGAELIYLGATREDCLSRLKLDQHRGDEWRAYIDKWFDRYTE